MKYLCLVYQEEPRGGRGAMAAESRDECEALRQSGNLIVASSLQPATAAITIWVRNGQVSVAAAPFATPNAPLAAFSLLEARDLNDAIRVAAKMPAARLGAIEVRPLEERAGPGCG